MGSEVSFIVTARDESPAVLQETIDGLLATASHHLREIILVDDASLLPVALERPQLLVIRTSAAVGVARSRRLGASIATGSMLAWTDAHMRFAPDWLERMLEHVETRALLCAAWWDYEMTHAICFGGEFIWCGERNYHAGKTPGFAFRHRTRFPGDGAVEVPMAVGACYLMLQESYEQIGGYSPFFRIWGKSEQDISLRAWLTGVGVKCVTGAHVGHLSRSRFPYPVKWADIEFNQVAMVRAAFEDPVSQAIEEMMQPLPHEVQDSLSAVNFRAWRQRIQAHRRITDAEFFARFVPDIPEPVTHACAGALAPHSTVGRAILPAAGLSAG